MSLLTYSFDELPLVTMHGLTIATANGEATISYDRDGGFRVTDIWVNGWRKKTDVERDADADSGKRGLSPYFERLIPLAADSAYYAVIKAFVEKDDLGHIAEKIDAALGDTRTSWPVTRAEHRREMAEAR